MIQRALVLALTLALLACAPRTAPTVAVVPFASPELSSGVRAGHVAITGQPTPAALRALAAEGFTTVVSLRDVAELDWDEQAVVDSLGMRFVRIPVPLPLEPITTAQVAALDQVLRTGDGPVLLHCAAGVRAAVLWARWMETAHGADPAVTLPQVERAGIRLPESAVARMLGNPGR